MAPTSTTVETPTLVLACGALAREIRAVLQANDLTGAITLECLPAELHNRPARIADALEARLQRSAHRYDRVVIGYMDCGTQGAVDAVAARWGAQRLDGPHCYSSFATAPVFDALADAEPGTFYLTDYLVRFFDRWVVQGLGLDRHPELLEAYFGNYTRVLYLSQDPTPALLEGAAAAAARLGLPLVHHHVGYGEVATALVNLGLRRRTPVVVGV